MNFQKTYSSAGLLVMLMLSTSIAEGKSKTPPMKEAESVSAESRLQEWNARDKETRGAPDQLCLKEYARLATVEAYFSSLQKKFAPLPPKKLTVFRGQSEPLKASMQEELEDDPDWHQYRLQQKIENLLGLLEHYAGKEGWAAQEKVLKAGLGRLRGRAPYTVSEQAEPFDGLKDLLKIRRAMEAAFKAIDSSYVEWNRLIAFDPLARLEIDDRNAYDTLRNKFLTEVVDPVMECHLDYLSHF